MNVDLKKKENRMLEQIIFNNKRFKTEDDCNVIDFTNNTVILCSNYKLMDSLTTEIVNTVNGTAEYNDYWIDDTDVNAAKLDLCFGLQRIIDINGQKITLALEPAIIYKAEKIEDIWFFDCRVQENKYEEFIYPMSIFKGSLEIWNAGKDIVYKTICNGQYGCYDGSWVNIK